MMACPIACVPLSSRGATTITMITEIGNKQKTAIVPILTAIFLGRRHRVKPAGKRDITTPQLPTQYQYLLPLLLMPYGVIFADRNISRAK
jgi:hypothetical protein